MRCPSSREIVEYRDTRDLAARARRRGTRDVRCERPGHRTPFADGCIHVRTQRRRMRGEQRGDLRRIDHRATTEGHEAIGPRISRESHRFVERRIRRLDRDRIEHRRVEPRRRERLCDLRKPRQCTQSRIRDQRDAPHAECTRAITDLRERTRAERHSRRIDGERAITARLLRCEVATGHRGRTCHNWRVAARVVRSILYAGSLAAEMLIALAWWWHPEHATMWAIIAGSVLLVAAIVDYGSRR
jgi:hypothetical protein